MKKMHIALIVLVIAALAGYFSLNQYTFSIGGSKNGVSAKKIKIIATMFPQYDFARAVAGDKAEIKMLVKPGADVHSFEPAPSDVLEVKSVAVFIENGGDVDEWAEKLLDATENKSLKVVRFMDVVSTLEEEDKEGMEPEDEHDHEHSGHDHDSDSDHDHGHDVAERDEHVWTSPANAIKLVSATADAICAADPENSAYYRKNEESYIEKLQKLDEEFKEAVKDGNRKLVLFGDRFPLLYFVKEYGLDYRAAFKGCGAHTDASAATVAYLIDTVRRQKLPVIFCTETSNPSIAKTISEQTGVPILIFHSCHNVSLNDFNDGATYVSLMTKNLANLKKGLK